MMPGARALVCVCAGWCSNKSRAHRTLTKNVRDSVMNAEGVKRISELSGVGPLRHGVSKKKLKQKAVRIKHMKRAACAPLRA